MPDYDGASFEPPAPLARVRLLNPQTRATVENVPMLLDSGADVTLIPMDAVRQLQIAAESNKQYELIGFDGNVSHVSAVIVDLIFMNRTFHGQYLPIEQEWGVLGRNLLNLLLVTLDGPNLAWTVDT